MKTEVIKQKSFRRSAKDLWALMSGSRVKLISAIATLSLATLASLLVPIVTAHVIDDVIPHIQDAESAKNLISPALGVVALTAIGGFFMYLKSRWSSVASQEIAERIRNRLFSHLQRVPSRVLDYEKTGDLVQRCTTDVETVRTFMDVHTVQLGQGLLLILIATPILFWMNVKLAFLSLLVLPLIVVFAVVFFSKIQEKFLLVDEAEGKLTATLQENLIAMRVVKAFGRKEYESQKFGNENIIYRDRRYRLINQLANYWSISDLLCFLQEILVLLVGALMIQKGSLTIGVLVAVWSILKILMMPLRQMGRILAEMGKTFVAIERIKMILSFEIESCLEEKSSDEGKHNLVFDDVSFEYVPEISVLKNISFQIKEGEFVGIVGPTGSGKSTLVDLLLRHYDVSEGCLLIGGLQ